MKKLTLAFIAIEICVSTLAMAKAVDSPVSSDRRTEVSGEQLAVFRNLAECAAHWATVKANSSGHVPLATINTPLATLVARGCAGHSTLDQKSSAEKIAGFKSLAVCAAHWATVKANSSGNVPLATINTPLDTLIARGCPSYSSLEAAPQRPAQQTVQAQGIDVSR